MYKMSVHGFGRAGFKSNEWTHRQTLSHTAYCLFLSNSLQNETRLGFATPVSTPLPHNIPPPRPPQNKTNNPPPALTHTHKSNPPPHTHSHSHHHHYTKQQKKQQHTITSSKHTQTNKNRSHFLPDKFLCTCGRATALQARKQAFLILGNCTYRYNFHTMQYSLLGFIRFFFFLSSANEHSDSNNFFKLCENCTSSLTGCACFNLIKISFRKKYNEKLCKFSLLLQNSFQ